MYVSDINTRDGCVIAVQADDWDTDGIALVQVAINDGYTVTCVPTGYESVKVCVKVGNNNDVHAMNDVGIYLITQATE